MTRRSSVVGLCLLLLVLVCLGMGSRIAQAASTAPVVRVGSELDFPPYAFVDEHGRPAGFSVDLIHAEANAMGLSIQISTGAWDTVWSGLVAGRLDVLPIVAKLPERVPLVDFSLPHTETYDAFFVRRGAAPPPNLDAARGKAIVVMRSDAAHHALLERHFDGRLVLVDTIPQGLALVASGQHDAFLGSKLIGSLALQQHGIRGLTAGPPIPEYKRVFSFGVKKGAATLVEQLNQGLLIVKTNGEYDRIYAKWLSADDPWRAWQQYLWPAILIVSAVGLIAGIWLLTLRRLVRMRTRELADSNARLQRTSKAVRQANEALEQRVQERTAALRESEQRVRRKLESVLSPEGTLGDLELADIVDVPTLQTLMDNFYALAHIPMSLLDLHGRVLVGVGWQDICSQYHRMHPQTAHYCLESDTQLSAGVKPGQFKLYKCKNSMWDVATPLLIGGQHMGYVFSGQFLFDGEPLDREVFRSQAVRYGFDEAAYLAALDRVPRLSRAALDTGMAFFAVLAKIISQQSYSNLKLARAVAERDALTASLRRSEEQVRQQREWLRVTLTSIGDAVLATDTAGRITFLNPVAERLTGWRQAEAAGQPVQAVFRIISEGTHIRADDIVARLLRTGALVNLVNDTALVTRDGREIPIEDSAACIMDNAGQIVGVVVVFHDVSEQRRAQAALQRAHDELERRVHDRTAELTRAVETLEHQADQLRSLAAELTLAEQRERRRLAQVLHDEHQQLLVAAKLRMAVLGRGTHPPAQEVSREVIALLDEAIAHSRALTRDLSPPILHTGGLVPALTWLAGWMGEKHKLTIDIEADPTVMPAAEEMTILLFQSVRELLFNVVKHAQVDAARLTIARRDGLLQIVVADSGAGFDPAPLRTGSSGAGGFGLFSIRQRLALLGGRLEIVSTPGQGSRFTLWAPLQSVRIAVQLPPSPAVPPPTAPLAPPS